MPFRLKINVVNKFYSQHTKLPKGSSSNQQHSTTAQVHCRREKVTRERTYSKVPKIELDQIRWIEYLSLSIENVWSLYSVKGGANSIFRFVFRH